MASTDTIKEFLVGLGFKIDDASWKKFEGGVAKATAATTLLGKAAVGTATTIGLAVEKISREYESLYYISQRTQSTVSNLKATDFAMRQIGLTGEQAMGQIEGFTTALRLNPGVGGLLGNLGVGRGDPKNQMYEIVKNLKERFGEGGYFVAARFAQIFGLEERAFLGMWKNLDRLKAADADYQRRLHESGVRTDELAEKSTEFQNILRSVESSIGLVVDQTVQRWLPASIEIVKWIDKQGQFLVQLGASTNGYSSTVLMLVSALGALKLAAYALPTWLGGGLAAGLSSVLTPLAGAALLGYSVYPQGAGSGSAPGPTNQRPATAAELMAEVNRRNGRAADANPGSVPAPLSSAPAGRGVFGNDLVTVTTRGGKRVTVSREAAPSILGFLNDLEAGGAPFSEVGGYNPRNILGTNVPSKHASGAAVDIDQHGRNVVSLAFTKWASENPEKLRAALEKNNIKSGGDFTRPDFGHFEWAGAPLAPGASSSKNVTINSTTSIDVHGGGDPKATGEAVLAGQRRRDSDIVRNTRGALQ